MQGLKLTLAISCLLGIAISVPAQGQTISGAALPTTAATAPADDPIAVFRAYVLALRAGDEEKGVSFLDTKDTDQARRALLSVRAQIFVEQIRAEMTKQFGPQPKIDEAHIWVIESPWPQELSAIALSDQKADEASVDWQDGEDPSVRSASVLMRRIDGQWKIAVREDSPPQPNAEREAEGWVEGQRETLAQLKSGAFKQAPDVKPALLKNIRSHLDALRISSSGPTTSRSR